VVVASDNPSMTVDAASLPLPTGAATEAKQDTGNTALAAIETAVEAVQAAVEGTLAATVSATNLDIRDLSSASDSVTAVVSVSNIAYTAKGKIAGGDLTGTYATLLNPSSDLKVLLLMNSCNDTILVSLDGGSTDSLELEAYESVAIDLATSGLKFDNGVNISAKHAGAAPTAGTIRASGIG
jgi:hypothetical protein